MLEPPGRSSMWRVGFPTPKVVFDYYLLITHESWRVSSVKKVTSKLHLLEVWKTKIINVPLNCILIIFSSKSFNHKLLLYFKEFQHSIIIMKNISLTHLCPTFGLVQKFLTLKSHSDLDTMALVYCDWKCNRKLKKF